MGGRYVVVENAGYDAGYYVYTITKDGIRHVFEEQMARTEAEAFAGDLGKLKPSTVARIVGGPA